MRVVLVGLGRWGFVGGLVGLLSLGVFCALPKPLAKGAAFVELEGVDWSSGFFMDMGSFQIFCFSLNECQHIIFFLCCHNYFETNIH